MTITQSAAQHQHAQARAVAQSEQSWMMISTGLVYRDRQMQMAILNELAGTTAPAELRKRPLPLLESVAKPITTLGRRLSDGISCETLLEFRTEARRLFDPINRT